MTQHTYYVYIMTNQWHTVFYTGMTGRGEERFYEHKTKMFPESFTARYNVNKVVYVEEFSTPTEAAEAELRIKKWSRKKKKALIESVNPDWRDLSESSSEVPLASGTKTRGLQHGKGVGRGDLSLQLENTNSLSSSRTVVDTLTDVSTRIEVAQGQKLTLLVPVLEALGGPRKREIFLAGEGAEAEVIGLFLGHGDDQAAVQIDTIHAAPNTKGSTNFKAVLGGKSSFEFNGMIKIETGAQGSNDFLQQDSLMLSSEAKANSVPGLEIEANDVKASHGATAKPVDPEQKFYLMSRGLSEEQAEAMVVMGFLAPVLKRFAEVEWKEKILASLQQHFNLAHVLA